MGQVPGNSLPMIAVLLEGRFPAYGFGLPVCNERTFIQAAGCFIEILSIGLAEMPHQFLYRYRRKFPDGVNRQALQVCLSFRTHTPQLPHRQRPDAALYVAVSDDRKSVRLLHVRGNLSQKFVRGYTYG